MCVLMDLLPQLVVLSLCCTITKGNAASMTLMARGEEWGEGEARSTHTPQVALLRV